MICFALNFKFATRLKHPHFSLIIAVKSRLPRAVLVWSPLLVLEAENHWPEREQELWPNMDSQYTNEKREKDLMVQQNGHIEREKRGRGGYRKKNERKLTHCETIK